MPSRRTRVLLLLDAWLERIEPAKAIGIEMSLQAPVHAQPR